MKNLMVILAVSTLIFFATPIVFAQQVHEEHQQGVGEQVVEVGNKICPVSGEEIKEGEVFKFEYEGKIYNFCCKACVKDFKKNPQKYIEKLEKTKEEQKGSHHEGQHH